MTKGIIYLIQPVLLVGSNKYKLGCSTSPTLNRCIKGYLKGSRYITINECYDSLFVEKILIKKFKTMFKLVGGREHFEGDESEMIMVIVKTIAEYKKIYDSKKNISDNDIFDNDTSDNDTSDNLDNDNSENDNLDNDNSENDNLDNDNLENDNLDNDNSENNNLENDNLDNDNSENNNLENDNLKNNNLENDKLENDNLDNDKSENNKSENNKSENNKSENKLCINVNRNNYYCNECNRQYKSYKSLWNHNKIFHIKKPKVKEYNCKVCNKSFDNKQNKYYHQKSCKNTPIIKDTNNKPPATTLKSTIESSNTNCNNKTIIINNYRNDNLEYINDTFINELFKDLLDNKKYNILLPKLIENIKFNSNYKENHNIKIKSDRSKIGFCYDQNKWKAMNKNKLLDQLYNYSLKIFCKYFNEKKETLLEEVIRNYRIFKHIAKSDCELRIQIKKKIENIAYIFTINNENELDD